MKGQRSKLIPLPPNIVLEETVKNPKLLELDRKAVEAGRDYVDTKVEVGSVSQPDGYSY